LIGTGVSSFACVIFFLIYDRIQVYFRTKRHDIDKGSFTLKSVVRKNKMKEEDKKEEMAKLLYDEHVTQDHEVLCICTENKTRGCGLSIFLADREIQWYDEPFPDCCTKEADDQDFAYRNSLAAVAHWANKFLLADAVNLLTMDGKLVKLVCSGTTRQWRSFFQYEKKFNFRLFMQWTENYVCGEVDMVELWEEAAVAANRLVKGEGENALRDLPLSGWKIRRVVPITEAFHMVPHPGEITPNDNNDNEIGSEDGDDSDCGRTLSFTTNERSSVASSMSVRSASGQKIRGRAGSSLANDLRRSLAEERRASLQRQSAGCGSGLDANMENDEVFSDFIGGSAIMSPAAEELLLQL